MKKSILAVSALSALLSTGAAFAQNSNSSEGQITFEGLITNVSCSFASSNATVKLGEASALTFTGEGSRGGYGTTDLVFSNCNLAGNEVTEGEPGSEVTTGIPAVSQVAISVAPGTAAKDNKQDLWQVSGGASGVGLEVKIEGKVVPSSGVAEDAAGFTYNLAEKNSKVKVEGELVAINEEVTAGTVNATLNIKASYK